MRKYAVILIAFVLILLTLFTSGCIEKDCERCHGTGFETCSWCGGSGVVMDGSKCWTCGGKGEVPCKACDGDGRVEDYGADSCIAIAVIVIIIAIAAYLSGGGGGGEWREKAAAYYWHKKYGRR